MKRLPTPTPEDIATWLRVSTEANCLTFGPWSNRIGLAIAEALACDECGGRGVHEDGQVRCDPCKKCGPIREVVEKWKKSCNEPLTNKKR